MTRRPPRRALALAAALAAGCTDSATPPTQPREYGTFEPPIATMRRLTQAQYTNTIHDVFGVDVLVSGSMEPDVAIADLVSVGASETAISGRGVEQYEALAFDVAAQVMKSDAKKAALVPCTPTGPSDAACAEKALAPLGRRLFRRPLAPDEVKDFGALAAKAGGVLGDFHKGLEFGIAALLQSPDFLFRVELGAADPKATGAARFSAFELASRLSYFLWNGPPDEALLEAAERGDLDGKDGLAAQVDRMLAAPNARRGLRAFATDWLALAALDDLVKDPKVFTQISPDVGPAVREETLRVIERLAFELDTDFRDLFTTRETFVNRKLASIYGVRAPSADGFGLVTLPSDQPRRGLLGQLSTLATYAHPTVTSPTLRGKFIRMILLCGTVPPPPANLNTALPEPSPTAKTMRDRVVAHMSDQACSGCHKAMDPIGLGLEQFDGLGVYRKTESGVTIDASGAIDGIAFSDGAGVGQAVKDHPEVDACLVRRLYRYAVGHKETAGESGEILRLTDGYQADGRKLRALLAAIAKSDAFRKTGLPAGNP